MPWGEVMTAQYSVPAVIENGVVSTPHVGLPPRASRSVNFTLDSWVPGFPLLFAWICMLPIPLHPRPMH